MRRHYRRWPPLSSLLVAAIVLVAGLRLLWHGAPLSETDEGILPSAEPLRAGTVEVVRVVDGDTLIVRPADDADDKSPSDQSSRRAKTYRVRLIGIDTPETVKPDHPVERWGPEASQFTKRFVERGTVRLEFDKRRIDRYGRVLAYVYVDDEFLNRELVEAGLARIESYPGDSRTILRELRLAEASARQAHQGIWSEGSDE